MTRPDLPAGTPGHVMCYAVARAAIVAFADAIGDPHPAYRDPEVARALGHRDVLAPPTFVAALAVRLEQRLLADPSLGLDLPRLRHRDLRFTTARPVVAGDLLRLCAVVSDVERLSGAVRVVTTTDVTARNGPVARVWSTVVELRAGSKLPDHRPQETDSPMVT